MQEYRNIHSHSYENFIYQIHYFDLYIVHYLNLSGLVFIRELLRICFVLKTFLML
jgi:hypothetical protein